MNRIEYLILHNSLLLCVLYKTKTTNKNKTNNNNRVGRLLERGKDSGRVDDNMEVIRKRFKTHQENTVPILTYFGKKQNIPLHTIDSAKMVEHVYNSVEPLFL